MPRPDRDRTVPAPLTAASYAEMVTRYPNVGGDAVYVERAFGMWSYARA